MRGFEEGIIKASALFTLRIYRERSKPQQGIFFNIGNTLSLRVLILI